MEERGGKCLLDFARGRERQIYSQEESCYRVLLERKTSEAIPIINTLFNEPKESLYGHETDRVLLFILFALFLPISGGSLEDYRALEMEEIVMFFIVYSYIYICYT